jgi:hypothetical protein
LFSVASSHALIIKHTLPNSDDGHIKFYQHPITDLTTIPLNPNMFGDCKNPGEGSLFFTMTDGDFSPLTITITGASGDSPIFEPKTFQLKSVGSKQTVFVSLSDSTCTNMNITVSKSR